MNLLVEPRRAKRGRKWLLRIPVFWLLQIAGWGLLGFVYLQLARVANVRDPGLAVGLAITQGCGLLLTSVLRYPYRALRRRRYALGGLIPRVLLASLLTANAWIGTNALLVSVLRDTTPGFPGGVMEYAAVLFQQTFTLLAWSALYFSVRTWQDWRSETRRAEQAVELQHAAELQMLRYQLNPHFLFNALNSIRALVEEDRELAKTAITELSEFLRYSLASRAETVVPLAEELQALRHYCCIQQIRYEDRLDVQWAIDPRTEECRVLSFLLQPLVENAVKYGMQTSPMPLRIRIEARLEDGCLWLGVSNSGAWVPVSGGAGAGVGLENVHRRLEHAFQKGFEFSRSDGDGWVHVRIGIHS